MDQYMYLFRGGDARELQQSPEQMQEHMQKWGQWMQGLAEKGILEAGLPLDQGGKVVEKAGEVVTDGPFAEGKEIVGGYLIVKAADINNAVEVSKGCPIFEHGGTVEVRKLMPM
ncbi:YciI family protein [Fulvivirgaceae bacterium BMA10]|uniref:YciI family protein n=1 Tax=Splendidivirga corallicola TaxID=3051826 RepID=A0ABT8KMG3_9BACT|nr:YciI family protein [Fulvivirgaceae bacterium BMA10]